MPKEFHRAVMREIERLVRQCTCFRVASHVPHETWCLLTKADRIMQIAADGPREQIVMGRGTI